MEKRFKTIAIKHRLFLGNPFNFSFSVITIIIIINIRGGFSFTETLFKSVDELIKSIESFDDKWSHADKSKSIEMRIMNDQLLHFVHSINCNKENNVNNGVSYSAFGYDNYYYYYFHQEFLLNSNIFLHTHTHTQVRTFNIYKKLYRK